MVVASWLEEDEAELPTPVVFRCFYRYKITDT